ncbi:MAG TPA: DUF1844 domain-containing protein [Armatimonadota bacterium]|jgi:hypothetical protein
MNEEPILEVTDKRRVHSDEAPAAEPPETVVTAAADEDAAGELAAMDVYGLLKTTVSLLASGAWAWMGLTPSPFTGEMGKDLPQAKVAIDTVAFLLTQIDAQLTIDERRDLQNLLSMLRVNYVQQNK